MQTAGKVFLITGASAGIGAALARLLSRQDARLVLAARRRELLQEVANDCPGETLVATADVTSPADRSRLVNAAVERWGRVDALVNNAGLGAYGPFLETGEAEWRRLFEVNLFAPMMLTRLVLPGMKTRGEGLILNVASIGGLVAHSDQVTAYVASKHALVGFSRGLARDLAGSGVRVKVACPHLTDTDFFASSAGAERMAPLMGGLRDFMDDPDTVAQGIVAGLTDDDLIVFPTPKPAKAWAKLRDV